MGLGSDWDGGIRTSGPRTGMSHNSSSRYRGQIDDLDTLKYLYLNGGQFSPAGDLNGLPLFE